MRAEGLEPSTSGLRVRCSTIELCPRLVSICGADGLYVSSLVFSESGATRTPDLRVRSPALYPTELRAQREYMNHVMARLVKIEKNIEQLQSRQNLIGNLHDRLSISLNDIIGSHLILRCAFTKNFLNLLQERLDSRKGRTLRILTDTLGNSAH